MTREEAIKELSYIADEMPSMECGDWKEAIYMAIKALEQEPCEDAISRRAVLDLIEHYNSDGLGSVFYGYEEGLKFANAVNKLPSVNSQEPKWIPVSERLPETNDDVLVTDGVDMFVAWYSRKGMWQGWMSSDNNFERNTPIDAWMPLPEPYKAESEE